MVYRDGKHGFTFMKRFAVTGVTREREYDLTQGTKDSEVLYFTANPNGEAEVVTVILKPLQRLKKLRFELDFSDLTIKGRSSKGNLVSKQPVKKVEIKEKGVSTLAPRRVWFDDAVKRLNYDGRGHLLGRFAGEDKILTIMKSGHFKLFNFDITNHFDQDMIIIQKWDPQQPVTAVYYDDKKDRLFVKRFLIEPTDKKELFISEGEKCELKIVSVKNNPTIKINFKDKERDDEEVNLEEFIAVKGMKALGNQLTPMPVKKLELIHEDEPTAEDETPPAEATESEGTSADASDEEIGGQLKLLDF
jgi:topoisomerase-4 subunit A